MKLQKRGAALKPEHATPQQPLMFLRFLCFLLLIQEDAVEQLSYHIQGTFGCFLLR